MDILRGYDFNMPGPAPQYNPAVGVSAGFTLCTENVTRILLSADNGTSFRVNLRLGRRLYESMWREVGSSQGSEVGDGVGVGG